MDIYESQLLDNNKWSKPTRLPKNINTAKSELTPFIHPDGKTLFFASDGHGGMGNMIFLYSKSMILCGQTQ